MPWTELRTLLTKELINLLITDGIDTDSIIHWITGQARYGILRDGITSWELRSVRETIKGGRHHGGKDPITTAGIKELIREVEQERNGTGR